MRKACSISGIDCTVNADCLPTGGDCNQTLNVLAVSDPYYDAAEGGAAGVVRSASLPPHVPPPHPADSTLHNNGGNASHDRYDVVPSLSPGGKLALIGYSVDPFPPDFLGNNGPQTELTLPWLDSGDPVKNTIYTEIEAAVIVSPAPPTVHTPLAGVVVPSGSWYAISWTWTSPKMAKFDLDYSLDDGKNWTIVRGNPTTTKLPLEEAIGIPSNGTGAKVWYWKVPVPANNKIKSRVKVTGYSDAAADSGIAESGANNTTTGTLTDSNKSWTVDQWAGALLIVDRGECSISEAACAEDSECPPGQTCEVVTQKMLISSNTGTVLTVAARWKVIPNDRSDYEIYRKCAFTEGISDRFTIEVVKVTYPDGGESWKVDDRKYIRWRTNKTTKPVISTKVYLARNASTQSPIWGNPICSFGAKCSISQDNCSRNADCSQINGVRQTCIYHNPGSCEWVVTDPSSQDCKVKVELKTKQCSGGLHKICNTQADCGGGQTCDSKVIGSDVSDKVFSIVP
jgi:hypothetical protein